MVGSVYVSVNNVGTFRLVLISIKAVLLLSIPAYSIE